ncbi:hypothetical protein THAR02_03859 [Trichoderma harzianum]|uniref:Uncharacterized protein n=1 Tax=Trichoderma harzianum TaxID=5544 RepID=A0A0F9ZVB7_TRIHA|nr:hypothetical protein THAR02_03859 [Trichoderma harzianum]
MCIVRALSPPHLRPSDQIHPRMRISNNTTDCKQQSESKTKSHEETNNLEQIPWAMSNGGIPNEDETNRKARVVTHEKTFDGNSADFCTIITSGPAFAETLAPVE